MKNKKNKFIVIFSFFIILFASTLQEIKAQDYTEIYTADTTKMLPDYINAIIISNPTQSSLTIQLSSDKIKWTNVIFNENETKFFAISRTSKNCYCILSTTGSKKSKRILYKRKKYILFWDNRFQKWDIKEKI